LQKKYVIHRGFSDSSTIQESKSGSKHLLTPALI
jgi:hypothetical protein